MKDKRECKLIRKGKSRPRLGGPRSKESFCKEWTSKPRKTIKKVPAVRSKGVRNFHLSYRKRQTLNMHWVWWVTQRRKGILILLPISQIRRYKEFKVLVSGFFTYLPDYYCLPSFDEPPFLQAFSLFFLRLTLICLFANSQLFYFLAEAKRTQ